MPPPFIAALASMVVSPTNSAGSPDRYMQPPSRPAWFPTHLNPSTLSFDPLTDATPPPSNAWFMATSAPRKTAVEICESSNPPPMSALLLLSTVPSPKVAWATSKTLTAPPPHGRRGQFARVAVTSFPSMIVPVVTSVASLEIATPPPPSTAVFPETTVPLLSVTDELSMALIPPPLRSAELPMMIALVATRLA
eukprot:2643287-Rhodomonas_salina.3